MPSPRKSKKPAQLASPTSSGTKDARDAPTSVGDGSGGGGGGGGGGRDGRVDGNGSGTNGHHQRSPRKRTRRRRRASEERDVAVVAADLESDALGDEGRVLQLSPASTRGAATRKRKLDEAVVDDLLGGGGGTAHDPSSEAERGLDAPLDGSASPSGGITSSDSALILDPGKDASSTAHPNVTTSGAAADIQGHVEQPSPKAAPLSVLTGIFRRVKTAVTSPAKRPRWRPSAAPPPPPPRRASQPPPDEIDDDAAAAALPTAVREIREIGAGRLPSGLIAEELVASLDVRRGRRPTSPTPPPPSPPPPPPPPPPAAAAASFPRAAEMGAMEKPSEVGRERKAKRDHAGGVAEQNDARGRARQHAGDGVEPEAVEARREASESVEVDAEAVELAPGSDAEGTARDRRSSVDDEPHATEAAGVQEGGVESSAAGGVRETEASGVDDSSPSPSASAVQPNDAVVEQPTLSIYPRLPTPPPPAADERASRSAALATFDEGEPSLAEAPRENGGIGSARGGEGHVDGADKGSLARDAGKAGSQNQDGDEDEDEEYIQIGTGPPESTRVERSLSGPREAQSEGRGETSAGERRDSSNDDVHEDSFKGHLEMATIDQSADPNDEAPESAAPVQPVAEEREAEHLATTQPGAVAARIDPAAADAPSAAPSEVIDLTAEDDVDAAPSAARRVPFGTQASGLLDGGPLSRAHAGSQRHGGGGQLGSLAGSVASLSLSDVGLGGGGTADVYRQTIRPTTYAPRKSHGRISASGASGGGGGGGGVAYPNGLAAAASASANRSYSKRAPIGSRRLEKENAVRMAAKHATLIAQKQREITRGMLDLSSVDLTGLIGFSHQLAVKEGRTPEDPEMLFRHLIEQKERRQKSLSMRVPRLKQKEAARLKQLREEQERRALGILGRQPFPAQLPPEQERVVRELFARRGEVSSIPGASVSQHDVAKLRPGEWLNDEVINFYGTLIQRRSDEAQRLRQAGQASHALARSCWNVHYFNTFFFAKLSKGGHADVKRWSRKFDAFTKDVILVPINKGNAHWTCAAINLRRRRFEHYDSMGTPNPRALLLLRQWLQDEAWDKKKVRLSLQGWRDHDGSAHSPRQLNGYDCGVFATFTMEQLSRRDPLRGAYAASESLDVERVRKGWDAAEVDEAESLEARGDEWNFGQEDMAYLRRRMVYEMGAKQLLPA